MLYITSIDMINHLFVLVKTMLLPTPWTSQHPFVGDSIESPTSSCSTPAAMVPMILWRDISRHTCVRCELSSV